MFIHPVSFVIVIAKSRATTDTGEKRRLNKNFGALGISRSMSLRDPSTVPLRPGPVTLSDCFMHRSPKWMVSSKTFNSTLFENEVLRVYFMALISTSIRKQQISG